MFGYVKVQSSELLVREYELYKAIYCGTCHAMKKCTGCLSNMSLSYDFVFLSLVRMLYESKEDKTIHTERRCCIAHPLRPRTVVTDSDAINYSARSAAVLTYLKVKDDIADSGFLRRIVGYTALPYVKRASKKAKLPTLSLECKKDIEELSLLEKQKEKGVDKVADVFGRLLQKIFGFGLAGDAKIKCEALGYHLGKVIYLLDAFDDFEKDVKSKSYNPYQLLYSDTLSPSDIESVRTGIVMELSALEDEILSLDYDGADAVEHLIKNILYLGIVNELERICKKYRKTEGDIK